MNEPQFDASLQHPVQYLQKRHHVPPSRIDIHVLDVGGGDPQSHPRLRHNPADDGGVDVTVGEEGGHNEDGISLSDKVLFGSSYRV